MATREKGAPGLSTAAANIGSGADVVRLLGESR